MKKSPALLALLLALTTPLLSAEIPEIKCRKMIIDFEGIMSPAEVASKDLLQGIWINKNEAANTEERLQFNDSGTIDIIINQSGKTADYKQAYWHTETIEGKALLVWKETGACERFLKIDLTCEGITLTDLVSDTDVHLTYLPKENGSRIDFLKNSLYGGWTNVTYPFDIAENKGDCGTTQIMKGAFLSYNFKVDGSYSKRWGNSKTTFVENGHWEISKDGNHILLHVGKELSENGRKDIARIKMIDMDKLVLEQSLNSPDLEDSFCTKKKDFVFVK